MSDKFEMTAEQAAALLDSVDLKPDDWVMYERRSAEQRLAIGIVLVNLRAKGKTLRTIEEETGIPRATASRYISKALESVALPTVDNARKEAVERLERLMEVVWPKAEAGDEKAIATYLSLADRLAKITGTDKPIEISATHVEVTAQERELQAMLAQAERDEKLREAEIVAELDTEG